MSSDQPAAPARLTPKGQATRDRIVAAAAALIHERGVGGTSLDDVKAAAGVSSSQLYHYFADKRALVIAVIDFLATAVLDGQEPLLSRLDSLGALHAWRDLIVDTQRRLGSRGGCPIGSLGAELADIDPWARAEIADALARWEAAIRSGLRAMHERGELLADPDQLALATLAAVQGGLLLAQVRRDTAPLEVALDVMIDHISSETSQL